MSKNTFVSLGDHFEGFIEDEIARGPVRPFDACTSPTTKPPLRRLNEARDLFA